MPDDLWVYADAANAYRVRKMWVYTGGQYRDVVGVWRYDAVAGVWRGNAYTLPGTLTITATAQEFLAAPGTPPDDGVYATFNVGANTQSVFWEYRINGGGWQSGGTIDVSPNQTGVVTGQVTNNGWSAGDTCEFRLLPYTGDGLTGRQGTAVTATHTVT